MSDQDLTDAALAESDIEEYKRKYNDTSWCRPAPVFSKVCDLALAGLRAGQDGTVRAEWPENRCPQCGTVHPLLAAPRGQEQKKVYWLIEHLHRVPRQYLAIDGSHEGQYWTTDPSKAYRIYDEVSAQSLAGVKDEKCEAFEHMDCDGPEQDDHTATTGVEREGEREFHSFADGYNAGYKNGQAALALRAEQDETVRAEDCDALCAIAVAAYRKGEELKGTVRVPVEPTEHELWQVMIAGEMDTHSPKKSGLARARAAWHKTLEFLAAPRGQEQIAAPQHGGQTFVRTDSQESPAGEHAVGAAPAQGKAEAERFRECAECPRGDCPFCPRLPPSDDPYDDGDPDGAQPLGMPPPAPSNAGAGDAWIVRFYEGADWPEIKRAQGGGWLECVGLDREEADVIAARLNAAPADAPVAELVFYLYTHNAGSYQQELTPANARWANAGTAWTETPLYAAPPGWAAGVRMPEHETVAMQDAVRGILQVLRGRSGATERDVFYRCLHGGWSTEGLHEHDTAYVTDARAAAMIYRAMARTFNAALPDAQLLAKLAGADK